jgi:hypothetical protein
MRSTCATRVQTAWYFDDHRERKNNNSSNGGVSQG